MCVRCCEPPADLDRAIVAHAARHRTFREICRADVAAAEAFYGATLTVETSR